MVTIKFLKMIILDRYMWQWALPLALLIFFELVADILAKQWSLDNKWFMAGGALLAYLVANTFWLFALKNGSGLAKGAAIFSVASAIIAVTLGYVMYKEYLTTWQIVGVCLGIVSLVFILGEF